MKLVKIIAMVACACTMFGLTGCGGSPDAVALDLLETLKAGKADEAYLKDHCTEDTAKLFLLVKDEIAKKAKEEDDNYTVVDTKIDGDKATVTIQTESKKGKDKDEITLKKVDGKWKVDIDKEGMMKGDKKAK